MDNLFPVVVVFTEDVRNNFALKLTWQLLRRDRKHVIDNYRVGIGPIYITPSQ